MNRIFAVADVGKKNIAFGLLLFLALGIVAGIPLTVDLFGGSLLTDGQYQTWKVLHAYGVFVAFVNFFFGYCIDQQNLTKRQKEITSWSYMLAGIVGGIGRPVLFLLSIDGGWGSYLISFLETVGFVIGTLLFVYGQLKGRSA
jgi:membrane protease YdiL (CAAX protease family)